MNRKIANCSRTLASNQRKPPPPPVHRRIDPAVRRYLGNVKGRLIALV